MSRSKWKGFFIESNLLKQNILSQKVWSRSSVISEAFIGKTVSIHNGKDYKLVKITREKIGFKFGEFSLTRHMQERIKKKKKTTKKKK